MKAIKRLIQAFFTLSIGEQRAIIIFLVSILLVSAVNLFIPQFISHKSYDYQKFKNEIYAFRESQQIFSDSIKIERLQNRGELDRALARQKLKPFRFDPNNLPVELWKKMGLTDKQVKVIKNYENKGGTFQRKEDLKRMYCLSEAEYEVLAPYITIKSPYKTIEKDKPIKKTGKSKSEKVNKYEVVELNSASASELNSHLHIPEWLAERIVKYRNLLGGFSISSQLSEVYGFDSTRIQFLDQYITIDPTLIKKLNLNNSTFKQLVHHPYISYEITKEIANYREKHNGFKTIQELVNNNLISESLFIKLKPYLAITNDQ